MAVARSWRDRHELIAYPGELGSRTSTRTAARTRKVRPIMTTQTQTATAGIIVSPEEWLLARKRLLAKEKEFTRLRDELGRQRRELPWERVEKDYVFTGPDGRETLADLFAGRGQLVVYHFMFRPEWPEG